VFVFSLLPHSTAAVVWSDNFDDGDYGGWTVALGDWRVDTNGYYLENYYVDTIYHRISHQINETTGMWSFDYYHPDHHGGEHATVYFLTNGTDTPDENFGYGLRMREYTIYLLKIHGPYSDTT
jgi:hypothetical protein